ncbi:MAG TPA: hypothetical protein VIL36_24420 [Acidimicrobiales bacterium]
MERPEVVTIGSLPHPSPAVNRVGFPLDHPYVEQCMLPWLGPTAVLLLRRLPALWQDGDPVRIPSEDLAGLFGVRWGQMGRTIDRLAQFGLARRPALERLHVFDRCAPLPERLLDRMPERARDAHHRLIGEHLDRLAGVAVDRVAPRPAAPSSELGR